MSYLEKSFQVSSIWSSNPAVFISATRIFGAAGLVFPSFLVYYTTRSWVLLFSERKRVPL
jgi:hypothetical protein